MRTCGIVLSVVLCCACSTGAPAPRPNVLLIVVDTLRADHLSCYGYERATSPNVDRLAAAGWRYENAISQAPWTTPSIGALLTSRYPSMLGIVDERSVLPESLPLLPEVLRDHGYETAAVVSHSFCSSRWGFARGFESFDEDNVLGHFGISSPGVTERALEFLGRPREGPFFLWLHYFDPHNQYLFHEHHDFAPDHGGGRPGYDRGRITPKTTFRQMRKATYAMTPGELAEVTRYYDSEVAFTDHHVGRVLDRLDELGLADETVVIFTADHGEELLDHGRIGHAHSLFQELVHVPLIVRFPGEPPRVIDDLVSSVDVMPTLLDHLGIPPPDGLVGRSLLADTAGRTAFSETSRHANLRGAARGRWKVVHDLESGEERAYDLSAGEAEVTEPPPPDLATLQGELDAWMELLERERADPQRIDLSPELEDQLGDLGYLDRAEE